MSKSHDKRELETPSAQHQEVEQQHHSPEETGQSLESEDGTNSDRIEWLGRQVPELKHQIALLQHDKKTMQDHIQELGKHHNYIEDARDLDFFQLRRDHFEMSASRSDDSMHTYDSTQMYTRDHTQIRSPVEPFHLGVCIAVPRLRTQ